MAKKVEKKPGYVPENAPAGLFINAQYLKDLSFENPNPLDAYKKNEEKPEIQVNINTSVKKLPDNAFEVTLDIKTEAILVDIEATVYPEQFDKKKKKRIIKYFTYIIKNNKKIGNILTKKCDICVVYLNFSVDK